jgi:protein TonB
MIDWLAQVAPLARQGLREGMAPWLVLSLTVHAGMIAAILPETASEQKWPEAGGVIAVDVVIIEGPDRRAGLAGGETDREAPRPDRVRMAERVPTKPVRPKPALAAGAPKPPQKTASARPAPPAPSEDAILEASIRLAPRPRRKPEPPAVTAAAPVQKPENPATTTQEATTERAALSAAPASPGGGSRGASPQPGNPKPVYPDSARRQGREGKVILRVEVRLDGRAGAVSVDRSSGDYRLDGAALAAVRQWRFRPALRNGAPVAAIVRVPIRFRLR